MTPAGFITIDLYHCSGNATGVNIASSRPDTIAQVLTGKTPEQVLDTVPLLFSLCGNAQAYAALQACRVALGMTAEPELDSARDMLVQLETLREHAWRILLDWPVFIGLAQHKKSLAELLKFDGLFKRNLFRHGEAFKFDSCLDIDVAQLLKLIDDLETLIDVSIFNGRLAAFRLLNDEAQLKDWLTQNNALAANMLKHLYHLNWIAIGQNDIACLPGLDGDTLDRQLRQDLAAFSRMPQWQGRCFEATLLNRQLSQPLIAALQGCYGNGLIVRMLARLLEVALIPSRLRQLLTQTKLPEMNTASDGIGLAQVQAARGLLIHRLELRQGRVCDYCIVAPTEWNFHPEGVVVQGLKQLQAGNPNDLQRQAELLINAVDPCVQYALHLRPQP
ncbi:nickel-dependent hydrogenase large subunit [Candidatus Methylobacter oryzae]|uniref:Ni,Fe-hydrogenase I large subunit n=1 Tax=Candidatus Methylobacter oryzae TaxID=2497749 RepID=A0ABY3C5I0_9GAMM|nr:nickel-dependent hydrogenase large subunit [Candidatus Methylobacter oryzae]TRW89767.1 Ni,Fe-hydrogenase I large subunit [Candidatus Methylobacter oryzae]